jgi:hypothetical protein
MKPGKWWTVSMIVGLGYTAAIGCGDDDDQGGRGGRGGTAGTAGTAGKGGAGGTGGLSSGGTAGTSGAAGDASAGTGGSAGDGAAGAAGRDAGDAGPRGTQCVERCQTSDDCLLPNDAGSIGALCSEEGRCVNDELRCTQTADCYAFFSRWEMPCSALLPCDAGSACVVVGAQGGRCAPLQGDAGCSALYPDLIEMPELGVDGGTVKVCGNSKVGCGEDGACYIRDCEAGIACAEGGPSFCIVATGRCGCANDTECGSQQGGSKCNLETHRCGCSIDADCAGVANADQCTNGVCGCSGISACTRAFAGTSISCE